MNTSSLHLTLYTTAGCHLCDKALALLNPWLQQGVSLALVDIAEDELLMARYGVRIPVLAAPEGQELGWPFTAAELQDWLKSLPV
ncbi:glutaredoxin family protein [Marinospirillum alkaliphilum]|uniref:Glutaredoxin n=1 Tax=Marinospirillum alkaliphilum DSM 21637 TaxID=1122209 RepID=A0A1K1YPK0_9GAMM|nr:glutaredoxin family protein [Marinospirillum alkaliphilum]SFX63371.1 Glutaredoxin [Marinospirillum alkaliphilum DSM 21637]